MRKNGWNVIKHYLPTLSQQKNHQLMKVADNLKTNPFTLYKYDAIFQENRPVSNETLLNAV